jgi:hypothetical protein
MCGAIPPLPHTSSWHLYVLRSRIKLTLHGAGWCGGNAPDSFVFGRCFVRVSAGTLAILIKVFHGCPQSLQANAESVLLRHDRFVSNPFEFVIHLPLYLSTLYEGG